MKRLVLGIPILLACLAPAPATALVGAPGHREHAPLLDVRTGGKVTVPADVRRARAALRRSMGPQGFLSTDRVTGGVRFLGRADGYLSGPARGDAADVALRWVRQNLDVLGLDESDLTGLRLARRHPSPGGFTQLVFQQTHRGVPAFDNSLRINVARDGRIINVGGSPRHALRVPSVVPSLSAAEALAAAARDAGAPLAPRLDVIRTATGPRRATWFARRHHARLSLLSTGPRSARLVWRVWFEESSRAVWDVLVDAGTGETLRRASKVKWANGLAWDYYPGAAKGGDPRVVDYSPWLTAGDRLLGNNTHVYNDADGTEDWTTDTVDPTQETMGDIVTPDEEIRPRGIVSGDWDYELTPIPSPLGHCPEKAGCIWNHLVNGSWRPNRDQDGAQVFFFVNAFHDHLMSDPIGFGEAQGNFQFTNHSGQGKGGDGIYASNMDAAGQVGGRPIPLLWSDNANMLTRPDGQAPRMQMFLFEPVEAGAAGLDYPFSDVSGGSDGSVVYHEYTHGLSNRLITDADGVGALDAPQSGAMGEAWSDWYAYDFILKQGFERDTEVPGEIKTGVFVDGGQDLVRTQAIDCTLGAPKERCPRKRSSLAEEGGGGYTYEHFARVSSGAQVHADGEIWSETLMDLRRRFVADHGDQEGARRAEFIITRAMELSPEEPSYIDMRNAILQADVLAGKRDHSRIWHAFAPRGMGASAAAVDGRDTAPTAAFDLPAGLPPIDVLGPAVTIDAPQDGAAVRVEGATFAGTAVDDAGVTALTVNGQPAEVTGATWQVTLKLAPGRNTVRVHAQDIEGRAASAQRTVLGDAAAPRLRARRPFRRRGRVLVAGRATDDVGVARVTVAGRRARVARNGRFFAAPKAKRVRKGRVKIVITDRAGRTTTKALKVQRG